MPSHLPALAGVVKVLATCKEHQTIFVRGRRLPPHRRPLPVAFFQSNRQKQMGRAGCERLPALWVATRAPPMVCGPLGPRGAGVPPSGIWISISGKSGMAGSANHPREHNETHTFSPPATLGYTGGLPTDRGSNASRSDSRTPANLPSGVSIQTRGRPLVRCH